MNYKKLYLSLPIVIILLGIFGGIASSAPTSTILLRPIIPSLKDAGNPCLVVGSTGLVSTSTCGAGGGGSVSTSSPITQYNFPYWANTTGGLMGTSTLFYSSSTGNVGIGTTSPSQLLSVGSSNQFTVDTSGNVVGGKMQANGVKIGNWGGSATYQGIWLTSATPDFTNYAFLDDSGAGTLFNAVSGGYMHYRIGNSTKMILNGNGLIINPGSTIGATSGNGLIVETGNVGIGTTQPSSTLHIIGGGIFTTNVTSTSMTDSQGNKYSTSTGGNPTINAFAGSVFDILGTAGTISSTVSNGSTTFTLANTAVSAGSYTNTNLTVDAYGRITTAANGTAGGGTGNVNVTAASVLAGNFPFFITAASSTLSATSTLTISNGNLFQSSNFFIGGTLNVTSTSAFQAGATFNSTISQSGGVVAMASTTINGLLSANTLNVSSTAAFKDTVTITNATGTSATSSISIGSLFFTNATGSGVLSMNGGSVSSTNLTFTNATSSGNLQTATLKATGAVNMSSTVNVTGAVNFASTLGVTGVTTLVNALFTNATGTGNLQTAGLTFTNATGTGNLQIATFKATGQSTLASATSSNLEATGTLKVASTTIILGKLSVGTSTVQTSTQSYFVGSATSSIFVAGQTSPFSPGCMGFVVSSTSTVWMSFEVSSTIAVHYATSSNSQSPSCYFQSPN